MYFADAESCPPTVSRENGRVTPEPSALSVTLALESESDKKCGRPKHAAHTLIWPIGFRTAETP